MYSAAAMHALSYPPVISPTSSYIHQPTNPPLLQQCSSILRTHQYITHVQQDQEATATEVVTRKVRQTDPSISDEKARSALGALGLIGEKAIRKVGHLSGTDFHLICIVVIYKVVMIR